MKKSPVKRKPTAAIRKADKLMYECTNDVQSAKLIEAFNNAHNCQHCAIMAAILERASAAILD